jgi:NADP-dependent 3-hydroxy acid dehydrogenase YdfG
MKAVITGNSKLAKTIGDVIVRTPHAGTVHLVSHVRVEDILDCDWVWKENDVFINCAHVGFCQTELLMEAYNAWKDDSTKTIINISSRASQPNISKGYLYAAQKASLNHLSNNLVYNSDKKCRITTLNLGLLQHQDLPCISYNEVAGWIYRHCTGSKHIDIPEMTFQHAENYQSVQSDKQALRELENFTK